MDEVKLNKGDNIVELAEVSLAGTAGKKVFDRLNFSLSYGKSAVIEGTTGAGKTSFVELVIGSKRPDSGTIYVFGKNIGDRGGQNLKNIRRRTGGVGGIFQPIAYQTIFENLSYPLILRGDGPGARRSRVFEVLGQLNLLNKKNEKAISLSRGEEILLMLGRAIVADQPLLLIDEPLSGLDSDMARVVMDKLKRLAVAGHSLIILTSGQTGVELPGADQYSISGGKLE
ncbi:MAG: ATP-binding cassette domain-containing protein [Candidatus Zixiibacteriota bacterium]